MRMHGHKQTRQPGRSLHGGWRTVPLLIGICGIPMQFVYAQTAPQDILAQQIQQLAGAMARTQAQLEQSQRQLDEMRKQLSELERQMAESGASANTQSPSGPSSVSSSSPQARPETTSAAMQDIRERQAMHEAQIATQA